MMANVMLITLKHRGTMTMMINVVIIAIKRRIV